MLPCITLHCWKGEASLSAFPPPPCQHRILVVCQVTLPLNNHRDRYRLVHIIPGSWSTVFVSLSPPIWRHNFLGTYTMMQTQKLIWLKNYFFTGLLLQPHQFTDQSQHQINNCAVAKRWPEQMAKKMCAGPQPEDWLYKNSNNKKLKTYKKI